MCWIVSGEEVLTTGRRDGEEDFGSDDVVNEEGKNKGDRETLQLVRLLPLPHNSILCMSLLAGGHFFSSFPRPSAAFPGSVNTTCITFY